MEEHSGRKSEKKRIAYGTDTQGPSPKENSE
jgi:hypothetical protein